MAKPGTKRATLSGAQARQMFQKIRQTKETNLAAEREEVERRRRCPVELAKLALRRLGYNVFAEAVIKSGSVMFVVGRRTMTPAELMALAARICKKG